MTETVGTNRIERAHPLLMWDGEKPISMDKRWRVGEEWNDETPLPPAHDTSKMLYVSEIFGPTVQGEGRSLGRRCGFIRLGLCNLHCTWCDTAYTWDWTGRNGPKYDAGRQLALTPVSEIVERVHVMGVDRVIISGGEPLLHDRMGRLTNLLSELFLWDVEIETNGTIRPTDACSDMVAQFNVSPKLANSGNEFEKRFNREALEWFASQSRCFFKFVVTSVEDIDLVDKMVAMIGAHKDRVYIMPEGKSTANTHWHLRQVADTAIKHGYNLTTRLHTDIWGYTRGK